MTLSRRSLLGALAALPLWGMEAKGLVEEALHPLTKTRRERLLQGRWESDPGSLLCASPIWAVHRSNGDVHLFRCLEPIDMAEWIVRGEAKVRIGGVPGKTQAIFNSLDYFEVTP